MSNTLKQPKKLYLFSLTDLWERYGFYTMRGILVLYMTKVFSFSNEHAYAIFAAFTALIYLTPMMGGYIADRILGTKFSVIFGGLILSGGYALLALPGTSYFNFGLAAIICGEGLFMPNIATMVSSLYKKDDKKREGGFSIFYTAINVGAFFPPIITAGIIALWGWHPAFFMAAIGVLVGVAIFILTTRHTKNSIPVRTRSILLLIAGLIVALFIMLLLVNHSHYANIIISIVSTIFIVYTIIKSFRFPREQRNKLLGCLLLVVLSIVFSILYQQAGMSLTIYTEYNVHRYIGHFHIPTVMFQSLNPFFIILLGPLLAKIWTKLAHSTKNPSIPTKFGWGTIFMGAGFAILPLAIMTQSTMGLIIPGWIILSYFLQTLGEMFVSPIGLSMVSELSPPSMIGLMMGVWYFATAVADALAGFVSQWTTVPSGSNNPLLTSATYSHVFGEIGLCAISVGVGILFLVPGIKRLIQGT